MLGIASDTGTKYWRQKILTWTWPRMFMWTPDTVIETDTNAIFDSDTDLALTMTMTLTPTLTVTVTPTFTLMLTPLSACPLPPELSVWSVLLPGSHVLKVKPGPCFPFVRLPMFLFDLSSDLSAGGRDKSFVTCSSFI